MLYKINGIRVHVNHRLKPVWKKEHTVNVALLCITRTNALSLAVYRIRVRATSARYGSLLPSRLRIRFRIRSNMEILRLLNRPHISLM